MHIDSMMNLDGRTAIITGGAGLLGVEHATVLCELGCNVTLWDFNPAHLERALKKLSETFPGKVTGCRVDITDAESVTAGVDEFARKFDQLNVLINNAGMTVATGEERFRRYFDPFESYPIDLWEAALKVNLTGTFLVTQSLSPLLKRAAGHCSIINIASDVGIISPDHRIYRPNAERNYHGTTFNTPLSYAASKAALIHMTKYWATYWAREGIRVNAISPAGVENQHDPKFVRELADRIPLGRMARTFEYKGAIAFLASDASSFMTGANLIVDGGRTAW